MRVAVAPWLIPFSWVGAFMWISRLVKIFVPHAILRNPTADRRSGGRSLKDTQSTFWMSLPIRSGSAGSSQALLGIRAAISVPLLRERVIVGALTVIRTKPRAFSVG